MNNEENMKKNEPFEIWETPELTVLKANKETKSSIGDSIDDGIGNS